MTYLTSNCGGIRPLGFGRDLRKEFGRFFDDFSQEFGLGTRTWNPEIDVRETDDEYLVEIDAPGLKKDDIQLEIVDNALVLRGERKSGHETRDENYHHIERRYGSFRRTVEVPGGFQADAVSAKFEDGVLTVKLPKAPERKARRVDVE